MIVVDKHNSLLITGNGDVLETEDNILAIGSGGNFALSAAKALINVDSFDARSIVERSMNIAADICVFTNHNIIIEEIG